MPEKRKPNSLLQQPHTTPGPATYDPNATDDPVMRAIGAFFGTDDPELGDWPSMIGAGAGMVGGGMAPLKTLLKRALKSGGGGGPRGPRNIGDALLRTHDDPRELGASNMIQERPPLSAVEMEKERLLTSHPAQMDAREMQDELNKIRLKEQGQGGPVAPPPSKTKLRKPRGQ